MNNEDYPLGFIEGLHELIDPENPQKGFRLKPKNRPSTENPIRIITKLAFQSRFYFTEEAALLNLSETDLNIKVLLRRLDSATYVDLDSEATEYMAALAVNALLSEGIINSAEEKLNILLADGNASEKYNGTL